MDFLIVCPANCATGGPEALHEFAGSLNRIRGVNARLWYWGIKSFPPMPAEYERYGCEYVAEMPPNYNGAIVVPEIWANRVMDYPDCVKVIYWLGIDAYAGWTPAADRGAFLADDSIIHLAQSEYAYELLRLLGVKHRYRRTDTVNMDFYAPFEEIERDDVVLYNPAKVTDFQRQVMSACPDITFKPIQGMTRSEVIDAMRHAKLYLDFGEFPGRERMPREAVLQGCCLITSKRGSAAYLEDFRHFYKFESKPGHIWAIEHKIRYVLGHYAECRKDFNRFRLDLLEDTDRVQWQTEVIVNEIQRYHSRA